MWFLMPFVIMGNLATNRRAGTAALAIAMPILFLLVDMGLPHLRKQVRVIGLLLLVGLTIYYYSFKNSDSILAQPARAISSTFQPTDRDAMSNAYRDAENADLMATVKLAPIQGFGYGKHMLHAVPIADISSSYEFWDIMTHNSVFWVWMRVGTVGFIAFWGMICAAIIYSCRTIRDSGIDACAKSTATFVSLVVCMLMIFGLLDLQLSDFRDMLFTGFWIGVLAAIVRMSSSHPREHEVWT
jgi:O-antigen ligase